MVQEYAVRATVISRHAPGLEIKEKLIDLPLSANITHCDLLPTDLSHILVSLLQRNCTDVRMSQSAVRKYISVPVCTHLGGRYLGRNWGLPIPQPLTPSPSRSTRYPITVFTYGRGEKHS